MKDDKYIYAVACIRTKEKNLLKDGDIQTLAGLGSEDQVVAYLTERGWGNHDTRNAEELLSIEEKRTRDVLNDLGVDEAIIDILGFREIFHNLKTAIKQVCTGHEDDMAFYSDERFSGERLKKLIRDNDFEALPEYMREAAARAKDVMLTTRDGQRCDSIVDRACLDAMVSEASATKDSFLIDYSETITATSNIKIAVRACDTKKSVAFLEEALSPCGAFAVKDLARAAAGGREELFKFLKSTPFSAASEAIQESFSSFEKWCDNYMIQRIMQQKTNINSSGPIVAYYLARKNEIQMVRIIITAKANGFPEQTITERLRKMYG